MPSNANDDLRGSGDSWPGESADDASGRRRRAKGDPGYEREPDALADRDDILTVPVAPVHRLTSLAIAAFGGLLGLALVFGAYTSSRQFALVIFGVQLIFVVSWTVATRPPGPRVVAAVGLITAAVGDIAVAWPTHATVAPLGYVTAGGFILGALGQLARRTSRDRVTESLGSTLVMVVGVMAYATLIVLARHKLGVQSIAACLTAATVAIVVARLTDVVLPFPRTTPQVARGTIGIVLGAMLGTVASAFVASGLQGMSPKHTVLPGLVTAVAAVLADLGVGYAEASREIDGEVGSLWLVRHMQGPLAGFALAAPVAYVMSVLVLVPALN
jgi:FtsH-binding integral membrane protein